MFSSARVRLFRQLVLDYRRAIAPAPHRPTPADWSSDRITAAWLGHATVLVNFFGITILTDPVLAVRIGLGFGPLVIGPKRYVAAALEVDDLPPIDVILLTHAHMDHIDFATLRKLPKDSLVVTASRTADLVRPLGFPRVVELNWGETEKIPSHDGALRIEAMEVKHWGARMRSDDYRGYNGYLLEYRGRRIGISGDTAFTPKFQDWRREGGIDLLAMPIGAYDPWIRAHCTPEQAIEMAEMAGARFILPLHHQTFKLSWEPMGDPIVRFEHALDGNDWRIALREIGETFVLPEK